MKKYVNGEYIEMTAEEIAEIEAATARLEQEYWDSVDYGEAVNNEIRKRYSESQEFALLRQRDEKSFEFEEYFAHCEQCKAYVKEKKGMN